MLDIVVPCRPGENEELRFAARSWQANLPHRKLVVAGGRPDWYAGDFLEVAPAGGKYLNALANLNALLREDELTDDVIVCMDDTFVTAPIESVPAIHRGPMTDVLADYERRFPQSPYTASMRKTYEQLTKRFGYLNPMSYSLHTPVVVNRALLAELLADLQHDLGYWHPNILARLQWRSIYGNLHIGDAARFDDVKIHDTGDRWQWPAPFLSTSDTSFANGAVGRHIRALFPQPSRYEAR